MKLKLMNIIFLALVILLPIVVCSISAFNDYSDLVTAVETEEEQNEDKEGEEEVEEVDIELYVFSAPHVINSPYLTLSFNAFGAKLLVRDSEIFLPPPKKL